MNKKHFITNVLLIILLIGGLEIGIRYFDSYYHDKGYYKNLIETKQPDVIIMGSSSSSQFVPRLVEQELERLNKTAKIERIASGRANSFFFYLLVKNHIKTAELNHKPKLVFVHQTRELIDPWYFLATLRIIENTRKAKTAEDVEFLKKHLYFDLPLISHYWYTYKYRDLIHIYAKFYIASKFSNQNIVNVNRQIQAFLKTNHFPEDEKAFVFNTIYSKTEFCETINQTCFEKSALPDLFNITKGYETYYMQFRVNPDFKNQKTNIQAISLAKEKILENGDIFLNLENVSIHQNTAIYNDKVHIKREFYKNTSAMMARALIEHNIIT